MSITRRFAIAAAVGLVATLQVACTAVSLSPPLSPQLTSEVRTYGGVWLTSGTFARPHQVTGVVQLTQTGYRWFHEVEVVNDANPGSILYKVGALAAEQGAHGLQRLVLYEVDPDTPGERLQKQVESMQRVAQGERSVFEEGSETRWLVFAEMVRFTDGGPL